MSSPNGIHTRLNVSPVLPASKRESLIVIPQRQQSSQVSPKLAQASRPSLEFTPENLNSKIIVPPRRINSNIPSFPELSHAEPMTDTRARPEQTTTSPLYRNLIRSPPAKLQVGQRIPEELPEYNTTSKQADINIQNLQSVWPRTSNTEYRTNKLTPEEENIHEVNFDPIALEIVGIYGSGGDGGNVVESPKSLSFDTRTKFVEIEVGHEIDKSDIEPESPISKTSDKEGEIKKKRKEKKKIIRKLNKMSQAMKWVIRITVIN
ncbi:hypothetical protein HK096_010393, partial [Nowakowskiella sp. JEL0078]